MPADIGRIADQQAAAVFVRQPHLFAIHALAGLFLGDDLIVQRRGDVIDAVVLAGFEIDLPWSPLSP